MSLKKWLLLTLLLCLVVALFVGCKEAEPFPKNRELFVINGTTDTQVIGISIQAVPHGQRKIDSSGSYVLRESDSLDGNEQFGIVLSPFVYRTIVDIEYDFGDELSYGYKTVSIDFPVNASLPTYVTLINDGTVEFPGYTIEVSGEYVAFNVPITT